MMAWSTLSILLLSLSSLWTPALGTPAAGGNSDCARWCAANFANPGKDCTSAAAKGQGPCYVCGPAKTIATEQLCSGACTDTSSDPKNCGSCGVVVPLGQTCCSGKAVNLQTDPANCGSCGAAVPLGQACCTGKVVNLQTDPANCGSCGAAVSVGQTCCSGKAVDLQTDPANCGSCGAAVSLGQTCCSGKAVNLQTDSSNCGSCGNKCSAGTCVNSKCGPTLSTYKGVIQAFSGATSLGYIAPDPNYWTPLLTPGISSALQITFQLPQGATSGSQLNFQMLNDGRGVYLGLVEGRDSTSSDISPGSFNYLYLDPVSVATAPGATPQHVPSYFSTTSGLDKTAETAVWSVDVVSGAVSCHWINTDSSTPTTVEFAQSNHVYAGGDASAFESRFPSPVTGLTLKFIST